MQSDSQPAPVTPPPGLPTVTPPSGKFILQLFLVPGLIVAGIVGLLLLVNWLFGGSRTPAAFLKKLDDSNPDVRWRAASDLAQTLPRDMRLASNADFALKLTDRLEKALQENDPEEKDFASKLPKLDKKEAELSRKKREPMVTYIQFLTASLGNFVVPIGVGVLERMAEQELPIEPRILAGRRRCAVWALANLGQNLKRFDKLPSLEQHLILEQLRKLQDSVSGEQREWVKNALEGLEKRREGKPSAMGVDRALAKAAEATDPVLREDVAFALSFWQGDAEENKRIETTLEQLARDTGKGEDQREEFSGPEPGDTREVVSKPGLIVRINATLAQLRRGSSKVRVGMVEEMLDEKGLGEAIQVEQKDGTRTADKGKASFTVLETLKTLAEFYRQNPKADLKGVPERVEELTKSTNSAIQAAALQVQAAMK